MHFNGILQGTPFGSSLGPFQSIALLFISFAAVAYLATVEEKKS